jgi:hypothetical protein
MPGIGAAILGVMEPHYAGRHYAKCHYAECRGAIPWRQFGF